ncbi:MAG: alpha/beta fold hydrolase [Kiritimatiellae bacterium]|nr:alpha/beta fold hydrolase [Kiritimatiellia bacterium]
MRQQTFFLTSGTYRIAVTTFLPKNSPRSVLLFIPPFVEERKGALPFFVSVARVAGEHDFASVLFDFAGAGDSEGEFSQVPFSQLETDIETVVNWVNEHFADIPQTFCGLRAGAILAQRSAAKFQSCRALVTWSATPGKSFFRELLQRRMVNDMIAYGKARVSRSELEEKLKNGESVDLDGYTVSSDFYRGIQDLSPVDVSCPTFAAPQETRYPPFWNTIGHVDLSDLIQETLTWLDRTIPEKSTADASREAQTDLPPGDEKDFLELSVRDAKNETSRSCRLAWERPKDKLPTSGALFLHGWSGDRTGPHRLFVRFARELANQGVLSLRPDWIGRGLSDGRATDASIAGMADTAQQALDALRKELPENVPIRLVAICSGCKVAITLASRNQDLSELTLWSPESMGSLRAKSTGRRKLLHMVAAYGKKLFRLETWKKILHGKVNTDLVAKALVNQEVRSAEEAKQEDRSLEAFRTFRHPVRMIFGGSDPDAKGSLEAYTRFCEKNQIPYSVETIPHAGHSYYGEDWTDQLFRLSLKDHA